MEPIYVFPGTFCPPTFGHFEIARKTCEMVPALTIVCSRNPDKENDWYTEEECCQMWMSGYNLPENVTVTTHSKITQQDLDMSRVVIVRGLRDELELVNEVSVIHKNLKELGIDKYLYIISGDQFRNISSTRVRELVYKGQKEQLEHFVPKEIASDILFRFQENEKSEGIDWFTTEREKSRNRFRPFSYRSRRHLIKQFD
jgi:pantetheine-phosphate adenylyltransferase